MARGIRRFVATKLKMENALVLQRDAYEQALAQASLVRDALRVLMDEDVSLDVQAMAGSVLTRVAERYDLDLSKPRGRGAAQATFVLLLNLALDCATGGDVAKAARVLTFAENMPKLVVIAEKLLDEPRRRIKALLARNAFIVEADGRSDRRQCFELLPSATRDQLAHWAKMGLLQSNGWPLTTMAMHSACLERIERAELEVKMGRCVDWRRVLGVMPEAGFVRAYFSRAVVQKPASAGGLWQPLSRSLYINAMVSEAWLAPQTKRTWESVAFTLDDEVRRRVFVTPQTLRLFVERVVLAPEDLAEHYIETTARVAQTLMGKHGGEAVFAEPLQVDEVHRVARYAEELLRALAVDAYNFYLQMGDEVSDDDLDLFWHARVLFTTAVKAHTRLAQAMAVQSNAWERLGSLRSTEELAAVVGGFTRWPHEQQEAFFETPQVWFRVLARQTVSRDGRDGDAFMRLFATMAQAGVGERLLDAVEWKDVHPSQFHEAALSNVNERQQADPWFGRAFGRAVDGGYKVEEAREIFSNIRTEPSLKAALTEAARHWTSDDDWLRYFASGAFLHFVARVQAAWDAMSPERRPLLVSLTDGASLGRVLTAQTQEVAEAYVRALNAWAVTRSQRHDAVRTWISQEGTGMRNVLIQHWPRVDWEARFTVRGA
ncbi:MAG: hypothetical protein AAB570_03095, partial [Patescibacteria group bacterium]